MVESNTKLPDGWDSELTALDAQINQNQELRDTLAAEMGAEIERVRQSYVSRMPYEELERLRDDKEKAWQRVRDQYPIEPPEVTSRFQNSRQAAEILAHY